MNSIRDYVSQFFDTLVLKIDKETRQDYRTLIKQASLRFLRLSTKDAAYPVYRAFFECYSCEVEGGAASFLRFLDRMRGYEESASTLTMKQRDHFAHAVNVFLLGLCIYQNKRYAAIFSQKLTSHRSYVPQFDNDQEEFFFRWGMAALCHDIGYPVEIITNQVNDFVRFAARVDPAEKQITSHIEFDNFGILNSIPEKKQKYGFVQAYYNQNQDSVYLDLLKPVDLLAHRVAARLELDVRQVKDSLDTYLDRSAKIGRIDHGFFSAMVVLKWYGYLIQTASIAPARLYSPVLDAAAAILMHNFYATTLQRPPFSLGTLSPKADPLSFLLILCDELQEWNREAYGRLDKKGRSALDAEIRVEDDKLSIAYEIEAGLSREGYAGEKYLLFQKLLDTRQIFPEDLCITCRHTKNPPPPKPAGTVPERLGIPMPLRQNLKQIAQARHRNYNKMTERLQTGTPVIEAFEHLDEETRAMFMEMALALPDTLDGIDCYLRPMDAAKGPVTAFTAAEVEKLAQAEHDLWMKMKQDNGWAYGAETDREKKTNRYMVPYTELPDEIKENDRVPARELPQLLAELELGIYRRKMYPPVVFTAAQVERLAAHCQSIYVDERLRQDPKLRRNAFVSYRGLSESEKQSNRRIARNIPDKVGLVGMALLPKDTVGYGEPVTQFDAETLERLSRIEHDEWTGERLLDGWRYAPVKDKAHKLHDYMMPYDLLSESVKDYDRAFMRQIPYLADLIGYGVYRIRRE